jgi:hypothetical protein
MSAAVDTTKYVAARSPLLWAYLGGTLLLVLLVTSPFTIGSWVGYLSEMIVSRFRGAVDWAADNPLTSWSLVAGLGFAFTSLLLLFFSNKEVSQGRYFLPGVLLLFLVTASLEVSFATLPSMGALYQALIVAGGTPEALDGVAASILYVFANAFHGAMIVLFFGALMQVPI